jgi:DNA-binding NarL/FixJ family response regulator
VGARILLADDHSLVRQALRRAIEAMGDLTVVGEASTGIEAVELVRRLRPDLAVVDIGLPLLSGVEVARQIAQSNRRSRILVLTMHHDPKLVRIAFEAGAAAYVVKSAGLDELRTAIDAVLAGKSYVSPGALDRSPLAADNRALESLPVDVLTPREREVVGLLGDGLSAREIAEQLNISRKTVEAHRANAMAKLGLRKTAALVRFAIREGLTSG